MLFNKTYIFKLFEKQESTTALHVFFNKTQVKDQKHTRVPYNWSIDIKRKQFEKIQNSLT